MLRSVINRFLSKKESQKNVAVVPLLPDVAELIEQGADVLDVRSILEFQTGAVAGSHNIPVTELKKHKNRLNALSRPLVVCCASGMRSGMAVAHLRQCGIEAVDAGSWKKLISS